MKHTLFSILGVMILASCFQLNVQIEVPNPGDIPSERLTPGR